MFKSTRFIAIVGSIALLGSASAALAQDFVTNGRSKEVFHGDLDLSRPADQAQLRSRIARAANKVCASGDLNVARACKSKAIARVDMRVNAAIARAETGERYADAGTRDVRTIASK